MDILCGILVGVGANILLFAGIVIIDKAGGLVKQEVWWCLEWHHIKLKRPRGSLKKIRSGEISPGLLNC